MTFDMGSWLRAVWASLTEPAEMAGRVMAMRFDPTAMWTAIALIAVLNVLFLAVMQFLSPVPVAMQEEAVRLSPFALTAVIWLSLVLLVLTTSYVGQWMGGQGDLQATLTLMVWFHSINLTLEAGQLLLMIISPYLAALASLIMFGALVWCIINFINVLHRFENLVKSIVTLALSVFAMGLIAGLILVLFGITPGGTA